MVIFMIVTIVIVNVIVIVIVTIITMTLFIPCLFSCPIQSIYYYCFGSGCGEDVFLSPKKKKTRIQSPRYPDNYPNDYFCFWTVSVPQGHKLSVNFLRFDTEPNYDLLSLGTGYNRESSRSIIIFKHKAQRKCRSRLSLILIRMSPGLLLSPMTGRTAKASWSNSLTERRRVSFLVV